MSGVGREHRSEASADREGASQRGPSEERIDRGGGLDTRARSGAPRQSEPWATSRPLRPPAGGVATP